MLTEEKFLSDVKSHELQIIKNDGLYRHLRFKEPETGCMYFDIITWPGHLCYTGDMGTYVFSRVEDMLCFFRKETGLAINPHYWSEKILSNDRDGVEKYSHDKFIAEVNEYVEDHIAEELIDDEEKAQALRDAVAEEVLSCDSNEVRAYDATEEFEYEGFQFRDFWERDFTEYSHRYLWCCYALVWGIQQFDNNQSEPC